MENESRKAKRGAPVGNSNATGHGRPSNLERNALIVRHYEVLGSLRHVAKLFRLSPQRVSKIVQAAKRGA